MNYLTYAIKQTRNTNIGKILDSNTTYWNTIETLYIFNVSTTTAKKSGWNQKTKKTFYTIDIFSISRTKAEKHSEKKANMSIKNEW